MDFSSSFANNLLLSLFCVQIASEQWHWDFMTEPITVTSFAPCYGPHNSRYAFSQLKDYTPDQADDVSCFVMVKLPAAFRQLSVAALTLAGLSM